MAWYQRGIRYLWRKRSKSILLFFIFFIVNTMILGTGIILYATEHTETEMQKKAKAKVICEMNAADAELTKEEWKKIRKVPYVQAINRMGHQKIFLPELLPVTKSDSLELDNQKVSLYSYDNLKQDSPFFDHTYQLTEGKLFEAGETYKAVVHADFADLNGLKIGDQLSLKTGGGTDGNTKVQTKVTICGFFLSGTEKQQETSTLAVSRTENQIYLDQTSYGELFGGKGIYKLSVYTDQPEKLSKLADQLLEILAEKAEVTTSDALFQQMKAPLAQITRMVWFMQILTFFSGLFVVSLLLCMWMRNRQKEMAVFVSLGERKVYLFLQAFFESSILFLLAAGFSCCFAVATANQMQKLLFSSVTSELTRNISLKGSDFMKLLGMGGAVVVTAVFLSVFPVLCSNPKDILSRMEG